MQEGIKLYIRSEIGRNQYRITAYRYGMLCGVLCGYLDHRAGTVKIYPSKLVPGFFHMSDFPIIDRFDNIPWERNFIKGDNDTLKEC